jgi:hypothetical protein
MVRTAASRFSACLILTESKNPGSSLTKDIHHSSYKSLGDAPNRKFNTLIIRSLPRLCQDRSTLPACTNSQERRYLHHQRDPDWAGACYNPRSDALDISGKRNSESGEWQYPSPWYCAAIRTLTHPTLWMERLFSQAFVYIRATDCALSCIWGSQAS